MRLSVGNLRTRHGQIETAWRLIREALAALPLQSK